jgi:hypothetical protein
MRRWIAVAAFLLPPLASALSANGFAGWAMSRGRLVTIGAPPQGSLPVGSLQKPFIARAWAQSHGAGEPPTYLCSSASKCWRPAGHGRMDLRSAVRESCNTYFRELARETDGGALAATFRDAGFEWSGDMTAAEAIGLPGPSRVRIAPERLLDAYQDLGRTPWPSREDVRQQLLAGLRDAAQDGTAQGLNAWGLLAKTGTVPALDGAPLKTTGFALAMDDSGFAFLGMLDRGTGREAATRAASEIAKLRPGLVARETNARSAPSATRPHSNRARGVLDPVSVDMLGELRLSRISIRNAGASPVNSSRGYVGPGAEVEASPGDRFDTGLWRITSKRPAFERSVEASLIVTGRDEQRRIVASMTVREYADGVIKAELGPATPELRAPLAEAALRFLARGPRHAAADVCDSTHCAWFVGRGPVPRWLRPDRAVHDATAASLTDAEWRQARATRRTRSVDRRLWRRPRVASLHLGQWRSSGARVSQTSEGERQAVAPRLAAGRSGPRLRRFRERGRRGDRRREMDVARRHQGRGGLVRANHRPRLRRSASPAGLPDRLGRTACSGISRDEDDERLHRGRRGFRTPRRTLSFAVNDFPPRRRREATMRGRLGSRT